MKVDFIGKVGADSGIGNYSTKLFHALEDFEDLDIRNMEPSFNFPVLERTIRNFLEVPFRIITSSADVIHLPNQQRAAGLWFFPERYLSNVVVTVHDISPYINDYAGPISQAVSIFYCRALKKVPKIIAISEFTKSELVEHLEIPEEKIEVIYQGVDQDYFYPRRIDERKLEKYDIEQPYILYVGSEIDRKNMKGVFKKFKELQKKKPELTLVKVGDAGRDKYRRKTLRYLDEVGLDIDKDVLFTGFVDEEELPQIYSSAEATILWSDYEGFGRTALESRACGTEVLSPETPPMDEWVWDPALFDWNNVAKKVRSVYYRFKE